MGGNGKTRENPSLSRREGSQVKPRNRWTDDRRNGWLATLQFLRENERANCKKILQTLENVPGNLATAGLPVRCLALKPARIGNNERTYQ
jgi:hypothetical protein